MKNTPRFVLILLTLPFLFSCVDDETSSTATLPEEDYKTQEIEINYDNFENKIDLKDSFVLYVYSPQCGLCIQFASVITEGTEDLNFTVYELQRNLVTEDSPLHQYAKFTPAVIIYSSGKAIANLDSTKDSDNVYFETVGGFKQWITCHVVFPLKST